MSVEKELQKLANFLMDEGITKIGGLEPKFCSVRVHYKIEGDEFGREHTPPFDLAKTNDQLHRVRDKESQIKFHDPLVARVNELISSPETI